MTYQFNADEVFEMAMQMEKNGAEYYRKAALNAGNESEKKQLLKLAEMEDKHYITFEEMRVEVSNGTLDCRELDTTREAALYLQALMNNSVFDTRANPADALNGNETLRDILLKAVELEKESIAFYQGMQMFVPDTPGQEKIAKIIKEEMIHVSALTDTISKL